MKSKVRKCCLFIFGLFTIGLTAQVTVDDSSYTIEQLVDNVLIGGTCSQTSNWNSYTGTAHGFNGIGYFNKNGSNFPFDEGIVLTTGSAVNAAGPNTSILEDGNGLENLWGGDKDLADIIGATDPSELNNTTFIEFDFVPISDAMSFNFIFASEEYSDNYPCTFSDVFAFILTDENGVSENLAVLPNAAKTPIKVTTIHPKIEHANGNCEAVNEEYYNGDNGTTAPINFNGQTKEFTASATVVPGKTYHIKMVIADFSDGSLDSAVFLKAGSFNTGVYLGEDRTLTGDNPLCNSYELDATLVSAIGYLWYKDGVQLTEDIYGNPLTGGIVDNTLEVDETGVYKVEAIVSLMPYCSFEDEISLKFVAPPAFSAFNGDQVLCELDGDKSETFNLRLNETDLLGAGLDAGIYQFSYFISAADANANINAISNPEAYVSGDKTIHVRLFASEDCFELTSFELQVKDPGVVNDLDQSYNLCLDRFGGAKSSILLDINMDPAIFDFQWYQGEEVTAGNLLYGEDEGVFEVDIPGDYTIKITHRTIGCEFLRATKVIGISPPTSVEIKLISKRFVEKNKIEVIATGNTTYEYKLDDGVYQSSPIFDDLSPGKHTIYVRDIYQCSEVQETITIVDFPNFFTPNGDNVNEEWNLQGGETLQAYTVAVFDRYGTLLKVLNNKMFNGWDGTYNGKKMPADDYWFRISYRDEEGNLEGFNSHFALKR